MVNIRLNAFQKLLLYTLASLGAIKARTTISKIAGLLTMFFSINFKRPSLNVRCWIQAYLLDFRTYYHLQSTLAHNLYLVIGLPSKRPSNSAPSSSWSPLKNLYSPTVISSTDDVACLLPIFHFNLLIL
ncbi:hypothetical protein EVAR_65150_1 [Eumeta japonica]|uniref:Uncharacterized protein n=1 Tax=Eumeta variegata TaxID=151549 RepID=A0A4C2A9P7_EUMVA|nr:hypothetical protein EVAR_65150_1 [Eumeta japonica]